MNIGAKTRMLNPNDPEDRERMVKMDHIVWAMRALFLGGNLDPQEAVSAIAHFLVTYTPPEYTEEVLPVLIAAFRAALEYEQADFATEGNA